MLLKYMPDVLPAFSLAEMVCSYLANTELMSGMVVVEEEEEELFVDKRARPWRQRGVWRLRSRSSIRYVKGLLIRHSETTRTRVIHGA